MSFDQLLLHLPPPPLLVSRYPLNQLRLPHQLRLISHDPKLRNLPSPTTNPQIPPSQILHLQHMAPTTSIPPTLRKMTSLIFHLHTNHRMLIQLQLTLHHLKLTLLPVDIHIPLLQWHRTLLLEHHQEMLPTHLQVDKRPTGALQLTLHILHKHKSRREREQQIYSV